MNNQHPSYLYVGKDEQTHDTIVHLLQKKFCKSNACSICTICQQITSQQHASILWLRPENKYTLDDFDELFKKITFTLEENTDFFFVIEQAHLLSAACANALLKIIEEPPHGYHFIFTAHHLQSVLPTIRSRSLITTIHTKHALALENIHAKNFIQKTDPQSFLLYISKTTITESEIIDLIAFLITYYTQELIKNISSNNTQKCNFLQDFLHFLQQTTQRQIMPGSGKLLLKELFIQKNVLS